jgi:hypothetical protein
VERKPDSVAKQEEQADEDRQRPSGAKALVTDEDPEEVPVGIVYQLWKPKNWLTLGM